MIELTVAGMSCSHCTQAITHAIQAVDAQAGVNADVATQKVRIESAATIEALRHAVEEAGYEVVAATSA